MPLAAAISRQGDAPARRTAGLGRPAGAGDGARRRDGRLRAAHGQRAATLGDLDHELDEDIPIAGDKRDHKRQVAELIERIDGLRPINAGLLEAARLIEGLTPLLIGVNARHKTHAGIRFTGLPEPKW